MKAGIGNNVRTKTMYLFDCIPSQASWYSKVKLSANAFNEINFWRENLNSLNKSGCLIESFDASDVGYEFFIEHMSIDGKKNSV